MGQTFPAGAKIDFSADSYELAEAAALKWNIETVQLEKGRYDCSIQAVHTQQMQLGRSCRSVGTRIEGQVPEGTVTLAFSLNPSARIQFRGQQVGADDMIVQDDARGLDFSFMGGVDILTVAVTHEELNLRAHAYWGKPFPYESRTGLFRLSDPRASARVKQDLANCLTESLETAESLAGDRSALQLENRVLDGIFGTLEDRSKARGSVERHRAARNAVDIMHALCKEDISMAGLCLAVGANRRTLHLGFMELYGIPPMKYLRALRLCKVRRDLVTDSADVRVTDVAMAWGFNHLGRFSGAYREFFGELPSARKTHPGSNNCSEFSSRGLQEPKAEHSKTGWTRCHSSR